MHTPQLPPSTPLPAIPDPPPAPDYYAQLNLRQQRFVDAYVANGGNGTQAYLAAGYSPEGADDNASHLLADNYRISHAISVKRAELSARAALTREQYVADLRDAVDADGAQLVDPNTFSPTNPHTWPLALRKLIQGVDVTEKSIKVRISDRTKLRELLGRTLGFFEQQSRGSTFFLIIQAPPGDDEPRRVGADIPIAPGISLQVPPDASR